MHVVIVGTGNMGRSHLRSLIAPDHPCFVDAHDRSAASLDATRAFCDAHGLRADHLRLHEALGDALATITPDTVVVIATTAERRLDLECRDRRVQLRPLESCGIFQGFDVVEPTPDRPVREYRPRLIDQRTCQAPDGRFKPGFLRQALHFLGIEDQTAFGFEPATLADALWVARFVEDLLSRPAGAWSHGAS